jgi:hypothetical protein
MSRIAVAHYVQPGALFGRNDMPRFHRDVRHLDMVRTMWSAASRVLAS